MGFKNLLNSRFGAVATGSVAIALLSASAGYTAGQIGSADIADDSVRSVDIHDGTIRNRDLSESAQYQGSKWSIVDRNVIGNGDSYLRAGPDGAPYGVGSLGIRTGGPEDKAAFGNQVSFGGDPLAGISTVAYSVYTTGENNSRNAENGPSVIFEIDPTGADDNTTGPNYSSLVYVPTAADSNQWTRLDASSADRWFLTGAAGGSSGCTQASYCTLDDVKSEYPNATLLTAQITKGRDYAFSGAVDGLQINDKVYDFEPTGVAKTSPAAG